MLWASPPTGKMSRYGADFRLVIRQSDVETPQVEVCFVDVLIDNIAITVITAPMPIKILYGFSNKLITRSVIKYQKNIRINKNRCILPLSLCDKKSYKQLFNKRV